MNPQTVTISPAKYAAVEMQRLAGLAFALAALPVSACAAAAFVMADYRFVLVALMLLMVAYPGIAAVAWLRLAASPSVAAKIRPQVWTFGPEAVRIDYYPHSNFEVGMLNVDASSCSDSETEVPDVVEHSASDDSPVDSAAICYSELKKFEIRGKYAYFFTVAPTFRASGEYYIIYSSLLPEGLAQRLTELLYDTEQ